jgi:hypothetical protein
MGDRIALGALGRAVESPPLQARRAVEDAAAEPRPTAPRGDLDALCVETPLAAAGFDSPRVETAHAPREASNTHAPPAQGLDLELVPPDERGLGLVTSRIPLPELGSSWSLADWAHLPTCHLIPDQGRYVGWIEHGIGGTERWIAVCGDGCLVVEATGRPRWHATAPLAARTLKQARLDA